MGYGYDCNAINQQQNLWSLIQNLNFNLEPKKIRFDYEKYSFITLAQNSDRGLSTNYVGLQTVNMNSD